ncbi:MAG TPA: PEP-CTERM sorting domain-containing protein [Tepidisphaeraceae bacterium]|jgi:hypothetical protein|nr:PEP-CTERM sorting domain-containing protein [Tepidisphaeraceae bacterium]
MSLATRDGLVVALVGLMGMAGVANGGQITWSGQSLIAGDSDVSTQGTLVYAYSLGDNVTPVVNGVTFTPAVSNDGSPNFDYADTHVLLHNYTQYTGFGAPSNITPGSQYANLLSSAGYAPNAGNDMVFTLSVTPGSSYLLQVWANDARGDHVGSIETLTDSSGGAPGGLTIGEAYPTGFGGTFITGTFTADSSLETITIDGSVDEQQINAFQLRNVTPTPEPASGLLFGIGIAALAVRHRRAIA